MADRNGKSYPLDWTMADLEKLVSREQSDITVMLYLDGRSIASTNSGQWRWDKEATDWVPASQWDLKPTISVGPVNVPVLQYPWEKQNG